MFDVITIGGAIWDTLFVTDKGHIIPTPENPTEQNLFAFEYGAKIVSNEVFAGAGGGAANTAVGIRRLGLKTAGVFALGDDPNGKMIKDILKKEKVDTRFIQKFKNLFTGFSFILVDAKDGDHTVFSYRGASTKLKVEGRKLKAQKAKWFYITSLSGDWQKVIDDIIKIKKQNPGLGIAFNPGAAQLATGVLGLKEILSVTDILFVNKDEAIELAKSEAESCGVAVENDRLNDINFLFGELRKIGIKTIVITDGKNGAYAGNGDKILFGPAISKTRIDTTGAGDSFGCAFLGSYILNEGNLETSLKYGIINSNSVVNEYGAQKGLLTKKAIEKDLNLFQITFLQ